MQIKMKQLLLLLAIVFLSYSCAEESISPEPIDLQEGFFPLELGKTWIYETDSIVYNKQLSTVDTLRGFVREEIVDAFVAADESIIYVIDRSFRRSEALPWRNTDVFSASIIDNKVTRNEENLRFVKLILPPVIDQEWDGNQFFDESTPVTINGETIEVYKNWDSKVVSMEGNVTINGIDYSNTVEVILVDTNNSIEKRYAKEIYAFGVGLIHKEMIIIDSQDEFMTGLPICERPEKGFILDQRLIESF